MAGPPPGIARPTSPVRTWNDDDDSGSRCQWRPKTTHFWQSKISHFERAVVVEHPLPPKSEKTLHRGQGTRRRVRSPISSSLECRLGYRGQTSQTPRDLAKRGMPPPSQRRDATRCKRCHSKSIRRTAEGLPRQEPRHPVRKRYTSPDVRISVQTEVPVGQSISVYIVGEYARMFPDAPGTALAEISFAGMTISGVQCRARQSLGPRESTNKEAVWQSLYKRESTGSIDHGCRAAGLSGRACVARARRGGGNRGSTSRSLRPCRAVSPVPWPPAPRAG